jgi:hypothetical protein
MPGNSEAAQEALEALDASLAGMPGLILSFVTEVESDRLGRIALWHSKEDANQVAVREDVLALRARLQRLSLSTKETLMELRSGHVPQHLASQLAGDLDLDFLTATAEAVA